MFYAEVRHGAMEHEEYVWSYVKSPRPPSGGDCVSPREENETINQLKKLKEQTEARMNNIR